MKAILLVFSGLFGAAVGSFLNVCIYRIPRPGLSVLRPRRSFCPSCGKGIAAVDNIPLVSWVVLGGRCRSCHSPISVRYPLIELLTALSFLWLAEKYLLAGEPSFAAFFIVGALTCALIVASFIDVEFRIIPDEITLGGMVLAPAVVLLEPRIHDPALDGGLGRGLESLAAWLRPISGALPEFLKTRSGAALLSAVTAGVLFALGFLLYARRGKGRAGGEGELRSSILTGVLAGSSGSLLVLSLVRPDLLLVPRVQVFWGALLGMAAGFTLVYVVLVLASWVFRKPAMGFGDVKLMALLGAFTGWLGVIHGFFLACLVGSVVGVFILLRYRSHYLPFGPFLAVGGLSMILIPELFQGIVRWYIGLFQ